MSVNQTDSFHPLREFILLLRWNKPSGRLILLIPSGWSLWLTPTPPQEGSLLVTIILGGIFVSGMGCIANDLWDMGIDRKVERTRNRPLAKRSLKTSSAFAMLLVMAVLSLFCVRALPESSRNLCLFL